MKRRDFFQKLRNAQLTITDVMRMLPARIPWVHTNVLAKLDILEMAANALVSTKVCFRHPYFALILRKLIEFILFWCCLLIKKSSFCVFSFFFFYGHHTVYVCLISLKPGHWVFGLQASQVPKNVGGMTSCSVQLDSPGTALTVGGWIRPWGQN